MSIYEYDEMDEQPRSYIRLKKQYAAPGQHIPNKYEAALLRKLMSQTGMNEKEIREHKKYRRMLSEAQKKKGTKSFKERVLRDVMKRVTKRLKLPKEHPTVKEAFKVELDEYLKNRPWTKRKLGL